MHRNKLRSIRLPIGTLLETPRHIEAEALRGLEVMGIPRSSATIRTLPVNGLNVWPIICTCVRVSAARPNQDPRYHPGSAFPSPSAGIV